MTGPGAGERWGGGCCYSEAVINEKICTQGQKSWGEGCRFGFVVRSIDGAVEITQRSNLQIFCVFGKFRMFFLTLLCFYALFIFFSFSLKFRYFLLSFLSRVSSFRENLILVQCLDSSLDELLIDKPLFHPIKNSKDMQPNALELFWV